ncbi:MAG TPA: reductase [Ramlibacter sp.]|nr:reductase [Ramlibacter sp.]
MSSASNLAQAELDTLLGFAPDDDSPIAYIQRTHDWYLALGYGNPYRWAHYAQVPFRPLAKPLSQCTATIITTAAPSRSDQGPRPAGTAYNAAAKFNAVYSGDTAVDHDLRIDHVAIDFKHSTMEDSGSWFPLPALRRALSQGRIGALARRFHGVPTHRSQRHTLDVYCPEVVSRCLADGVDVAVLVPNCPVCHQTLGMVARHLEAAGIATVVMGCAKDIVEHVGVPRFLFSDFPLGNAAGRPKDPESQALTLELALRVLESAPSARTTVQSPLRWSESHDWKLDYSNAERVSGEELARRRAEFDKAKEAAKAVRASTP